MLNKLKSSFANDFFNDQSRLTVSTPPLQEDFVPPREGDSLVKVPSERLPSDKGSIRFFGEAGSKPTSLGGHLTKVVSLGASSLGSLAAARLPTLDNLYQQRQELQVFYQLFQQGIDTMDESQQRQVLGQFRLLFLEHYQTYLLYLKEIKHPEVLARSSYESAELLAVEAKMEALESQIAWLNAADWSETQDLSASLDGVETQFLELLACQEEASQGVFALKKDQLNHLGSLAQADRLEALAADYQSWLAKQASLEDLAAPQAQAELEAIKSQMGEIALHRSLAGILANKEAVLKALASGASLSRFLTRGTVAYYENAFDWHPGGQEALWALAFFEAIEKGLALCEAGDYKTAAQVFEKALQRASMDSEFKGLERINELLELAGYRHFFTGLVIVVGSGIVAGGVGLLAESGLEALGVTGMRLFWGGAAASGFAFAAVHRPLKQAASLEPSHHHYVEDALLATLMFGTLKGALNLGQQYLSKNLYQQAQARAWTRYYWNNPHRLPLPRLVQEEFRMGLSQAPLAQQAGVRLGLFGAEYGAFYAYGVFEAGYDQLREGRFNLTSLLQEHGSPQKAGEILLNLLALKFANQVGGKIASPFSQSLHHLSLYIRRRLGDFVSLKGGLGVGEMLPAGPEVPDAKPPPQDKDKVAEFDLDKVFSWKPKWLEKLFGSPSSPARPGQTDQTSSGRQPLAEGEQGGRGAGSPYRALGPKEPSALPFGEPVPAKPLEQLSTYLARSLRIPLHFALGLSLQGRSAQEVFRVLDIVAMGAEDRVLLIMRHGLAITAQDWANLKSQAYVARGIPIEVFEAKLKELKDTKGAIKDLKSQDLILFLQVADVLKSRIRESYDAKSAGLLAKLDVLQAEKVLREVLSKQEDFSDPQTIALVAQYLGVVHGRQAVAIPHAIDYVKKVIQALPQYAAKAQANHHARKEAVRDLVFALSQANHPSLRPYFLILILTPYAPGEAGPLIPAALITSDRLSALGESFAFLEGAEAAEVKALLLATVEDISTHSSRLFSEVGFIDRAAAALKLMAFLLKGLDRLGHAQGPSEMVDFFWNYQNFVYGSTRHHLGLGAHAGLFAKVYVVLSESYPEQAKDLADYLLSDLEQRMTDQPIVDVEAPELSQALLTLGTEKAVELWLKMTDEIPADIEEGLKGHHADRGVDDTPWFPNRPFVEPVAHRVIDRLLDLVKVINRSGVRRYNSGAILASLPTLVQAQQLRRVTDLYVQTKLPRLRAEMLLALAKGNNFDLAMALFERDGANLAKSLDDYFELKIRLHRVFLKEDHASLYGFFLLSELKKLLLIKIQNVSPRDQATYQRNQAKLLEELLSLSLEASQQEQFIRQLQQFLRPSRPLFHLASLRALARLDADSGALLSTGAKEAGGSLPQEDLARLFREYPPRWLADFQQLILTCLSLQSRGASPVESHRPSNKEKKQAWQGLKSFVKKLKNPN